MTHFPRIMGAGVLALIMMVAISLPSFASAQVVDLSAPPPAQHPAATAPVGSSTETVVVTTLPPLGQTPRFLRDYADAPDARVVTQAEWLAARPGDVEGFQAASVATGNLCNNTLSFAGRAQSLMERYATMNPRFAAAYEQVMGLDRVQSRGRFWRRVAGLFATGIATYFSGGTYGAVVGASMLGNEANNMASDRAMSSFRDVMLLNIEVTMLNVEASILQLEVMFEYAYLVEGYCASR